ncbi:nitroreductase [candidate division KD3-62 bacterium DG_56]|uniref:Nitroreductase n=1 Tax=candidate division KD3-62 bacterium DG_56 TaxID=1704032 RepID=A0A0S7XIZ1_9BACT|nr:MAG: nitroreductase [candidate division KD3-62 bacterium DG_56]
MEKPAPVEHPIHELLARRWSPRAIDPSRPLTAEEIDRLLEAARWAPSSFNEQPWRYLVFDGSDPAALQAARDCLVEGNRWARLAPVLMLSVARDRFSHNDRPNRTAQHDVGLASENLVLQAVAMGLAAHQMSGFSVQRAREAFNIAEGYTPLAMIAIGHHGRIEDLPEDKREAETAPRTRKALSEIAYWGAWDARRQR